MILLSSWFMDEWREGGAAKKGTSRPKSSSRGCTLTITAPSVSMRKTQHQQRVNRIHGGL